MSILEHFFKVLFAFIGSLTTSLYLEARIRIRTTVKGRIRIRIKVRGTIRIRIRIRIKVTPMRNTAVVMNDLLEE
jgi:hypothetical protein